MANNKLQRIPFEATYRGGPLDGEKYRRSTNKFPMYRTDRGTRMGTATQKSNWDKRHENHEQPTAGYRLMLLPPRGRSVVPHAEYWHHTMFWQLAENEDRFWERAEQVEEWEQVAITRTRFPESFKQAVKVCAPQQAAFWIDCIEIALEEGHTTHDGRSTAEVLAADIGVTLPLH